MNKIYHLFFGFVLLSPHLDAQTDTLPPTLVCKQIPSIGFVLCNLTLSVNDFIENLSDDFTPTEEIQLGIRKRCTGNGFPENQSQVNYSNGNALGYQTVELWARDNAGNESSCYSTFWLGDVGFNCKGGLTAFAYTKQDILIDSVNFWIKGQNCLADTVDFEGLSTDDFSPPSFYIYHIWDSALQPGFNFTVTPSKNQHPLNGVTTYDLALITKHLLGVEPLNSPYKIIAADANQDGKVTTLDIVIIRRLILGLIDELPQHQSWRFIPYEYVFPNPLNPFAPAFPEKITVVNTQDPIPTGFSFYGVKIGDVNFTADPN